jgi:hypothetical protein
MTTASPVYGTAQTLTCTLASLATSSTLVAGRQSAVADNAATDHALDAIVQAKITVGSPTANTQIELWAFGTGDGTNYSGGAGASDANLTPTNKTTMRLLEVIPVPNSTANVTYHSGPHSIQNAFGGTMPRKWGVFVVHNTGAALNATAGNHSIQYTPVQVQAA